MSASATSGPSVERYRKIIARLEAKLEPISKENNKLQESLEHATLDREMAEERAKLLEDTLGQAQLRIKELQAVMDEAGAAQDLVEHMTEESIRNRALVAKLQEQVAELPILRELSEELELSHSSEKKTLLKTITELETEVSKTASALEGAKREVDDLTSALQGRSRSVTAEPLSTETLAGQKPQNSLVEDLTQRLNVLKAELNETRLDLRAERLGPLRVLGEKLGIMQDLQQLEMVRKVVGPENSYAQELKVLFQQYRDSGEQLDVSDHLRKLKTPADWVRSTGPSSLDLRAAADYLVVYGKANREQLDEAFYKPFSRESLKMALIDPNEQSIRDLIETSVIRPADPEQREVEELKHLRQELAIKTDALAAQRLKAEVLQSKAHKAEKLAELVASLESTVSGMTKERAKYEANLARVAAELDKNARELEDLRRAGLPEDLDNEAYKSEISRMSAVIRYYTQRPTSPKRNLNLEPLNIQRSGRHLSPLCGHKMVKRVWEAIDTFKTLEPLKTPGRWVPSSKNPVNVVQEQVRVLSIIDAAGEFEHHRLGGV